jgi:hypothetical protein
MAFTIDHSRFTVPGFAPAASRAWRYFSTSSGLIELTSRSPKNGRTFFLMAKSVRSRAPSEICEQWVFRYSSASVRKVRR